LDGFAEGAVEPMIGGMLPFIEAALVVFGVGRTAQGDTGIENGGAPFVESVEFLFHEINGYSVFSSTVVFRLTFLG
jgi:hypothetical protein